MSALHSVSVSSADTKPVTPVGADPGAVAAANDAPAPLVASAVVERAAFLPALAALASVVEKRSLVPILCNVRIRSSDAGVMLEATDLDMVSSVTVPGAADAAFDITAPARTLLDLCKRAKDSDMIGIKVSDTVVEFDFEGLRITLDGLPSADWPKVDVGEFSHSWTMATDDLHAMMARTHLAMSDEATRYYLNGVFIHPIRLPDGYALRAVATDGHRLCHYSIPLPLGSQDAPGAIIPRKMVGEILGLTTPVFDGRGKTKRRVSPDRCKVDVGATGIRITVGDRVITSKLVDGAFPDYGRVIPASNDRLVQVDRKTLDKAVEQVSVISSERGKAVRLDISTGCIELAVSNPDSGGHARMTIPADADWGTDSLRIGFNAGYIRELLDNITGDTVRLAFADPGSPALVTDPAEPALTMVLMPMRV
jgi:DNA polymerase-3 subunit beta